MTTLRFSWLGTPRMESHAGIFHLPTRKATALMAFLSGSSQPVSRERLAAIFWPEFNQTRAHANLRRTLASIHQILGPGILVSNRETIATSLDACFWTDVGEFGSLLASIQAHAHPETVCPECVTLLEKAVSLYRGDYLEGLNLKDCPEFDDWQSLQRAGFRSNLALMLEKLTDAYLAHGDWEKAILRSRQWASLDRLDEPAQRRLMQAYALSGQRSAAIRQYEECAHWLQADLGQSPEKETVALYQQIRSGERGSQAVSNSPRVGFTHQPLIQTKFFIPQRHSGLVSRRHLLYKLDKGAQRALTLISAPAGYGKTTLLSEWIDNLQKAGPSASWAVCWISLDPEDNDPIRFLTYLTMALEKAHPGVGVETQSVIRSSETLHTSTPLSMLINDLQGLSQSFLVVLDDYQFISNPVIHDGITFLLDHLPMNVHVVIATRSDPPIPIALFRSRNQLTEIRANGLRFNPDEAAELLNTVFGLALTPEQMDILENRTEGWAAGLQMAAISMQDRLDIATFIEAFSGSHRFIMDYLAEEALLRQPVETQAFLLKTSILERLSQPLCDFVLSSRHSLPEEDWQSTKALPGFHGGEQSRLVQLERSNLFVVPLDDERVWYRYHHLFAELLRTRLQYTSPELIPILHTRASIWFEKNGWEEEAIRHSLAAKDWKNAARLVTQHIPAYLENGKMVTILHWIDDLPQEAIFINPKLCALVAEVFSQGGMIDKIDPYLNRAEEILWAREGQAADTRNGSEWELSPQVVTVIRSMIWILRGLKAEVSRDHKGALDLTQKALQDIPEMAPKELAVLNWVEGWAYRSLGCLDDALDRFTRATEFEREAGATLRDVWTDLAMTNRSVGKLNKAIEIIMNSLQRAANSDIQSQGNLSRAEVFLSLLYLEQNRLDLAFKHASRAIATTQWWPSSNIIAMAYASLAQILLARNDLDGGLSAVQKADQERKNRLMTPFAHSLIDVALVQSWLAWGEWARLDPWAADQISAFNARAAAEGSIDEYLEMRLIMLVRVWMIKTRLDHHPERDLDCLRLLAPLEHSSRFAGRVNSLVEILILKASLCFSQGKSQEAMDCLEECLSMAEPSGYRRIFLNTGEPMRELLSAYLQTPNPTHKVLAIEILKELGEISPAQNPQGELSEPLTSRELEVLQLLARGCSNLQIAENLVLAEGTVKYHVHNLLGKLQVESRTQAIAKAKELDLI